MAQASRRKKGALAEPPPRNEIAPTDLVNYPAGELVDTGDGTVRRAWQITERVLIAIAGEKHAADAGDFVYELKLPGGSPGALEVLQADVAQGMGYEWRGGRESSSPFPVPGTTAASAQPIGTRDVPPGPPPDGTFDVYLDGPEGGYLSSITTTPELGKVIHLAGRGAFTVASIDGQDVYVTPGEQGDADPTIGSEAAIAQDLIDNAPPPENRKGPERRQRIDDITDERRNADEDRRASANLEERRDPDLPNGRRGRDPELTLDDYAEEEKRGNTPGRREADEIDDAAIVVGTFPYQTSDELSDIGPGAVAILERLVRWAKRQAKPWRDLTERQQDQELADLDKMVTDGVRELVVDVASRDFPFVHATLEKVEFSEGIKATITIPSHSEHRHELADHAKQTVTIVLAGAATWTSGQRPKGDPDQPKLV